MDAISHYISSLKKLNAKHVLLHIDDGVCVYRARLQKFPFYLTYFCIRFCIHQHCVCPNLVRVLCILVCFSDMPSPDIL